MYNFREYFLENPPTMYIYSRLVCVSRVLNTTSAVGLDKQISSDFNRHALVYFPYKFVSYRPCGLHSSEVGEVGRAELTTWTVPNFCLPVPRCGQNLVQFVYGICTLTFSCIISFSIKFISSNIVHTSTEKKLAEADSKAVCWNWSFSERFNAWIAKVMMKMMFWA